MPLITMDARLKHSFSCMVVGPSFSGKTEFVKRLLKNASEMIDQPPRKIIWFYGEYQPCYAAMTRSFPNIEFHENLPADFNDLTDPSRPVLLVIDDLMDVAGDDKRVAALFTKGCHHRNASVIYITQNLFRRGKESRTISLNTQYYALFKNCRDKEEVRARI